MTMFYLRAADEATMRAEVIRVLDGATCEKRDIVGYRYADGTIHDAPPEAELVLEDADPDDPHGEAEWVYLVPDHQAIYGEPYEQIAFYTHRWALDWIGPLDGSEGFHANLKILDPDALLDFPFGIESVNPVNPQREFA